MSTPAEDHSGGDGGPQSTSRGSGPIDQLLEFFSSRDRASRRRDNLKDLVILLALCLLGFTTINTGERADQTIEAVEKTVRDDCVENLYDRGEAEFERSQALLFVALAVEGLQVPLPDPDADLPTLVEATTAILDSSNPPTEGQIITECGPPHP